jgi:hypothetical protein
MQRCEVSLVSQLVPMCIPALHDETIPSQNSGVMRRVLCLDRRQGGHFVSPHKQWQDSQNAYAFHVGSFATRLIARSCFAREAVRMPDPRCHSHSLLVAGVRVTSKSQWEVGTSATRIARSCTTAEAVTMLEGQCHSDGPCSSPAFEFLLKVDVSPALATIDDSARRT